MGAKDKEAPASPSCGCCVIELYNWERPHDGLGGAAPIDRLCASIHYAPTGEEIAAAYDTEREIIAPRGWPRRHAAPT